MNRIQKLLKDLVNAFNRWRCTVFPVYLYTKKLDLYVHSIEDAEDDSYTDVHVISSPRLALNLGCLSQKERQTMLRKVNEVMALSTEGISFEIVKGRLHANK